METNIKSSLNKFYTNLREYQFKIDNSIKNITENIQGTIKDSIDDFNLNFDYQDYLNKYKNNKKLLLILSKIVDKFKTKKIIIKDDDLIINNSIIGNIKIQKKKLLYILRK